MSGRTRLTDSRIRLMRFILRYMEERRRAPSIRECGEYQGYTGNHVRHEIKALRRLGLLEAADGDGVRQISRGMLASKLAWANRAIGRLLSDWRAVEWGVDENDLRYGLRIPFLDKPRAELIRDLG